MIWIYIASVILVISALVVLVMNWKDEGPAGGIGGFFMTLIFGGVAASAICMIINAIGAEITGTHYETEGTADLAALQDGSSTSGSFFLGSGSFNEEPSFFYYQKSGNEYHLEHVDADYAVVEETSGTPHVEYQKEVGNKPFWAMPVSGYDHVKFYVPQGSVISNYTLDAN